MKLAAECAYQTAAIAFYLASPDTPRRASAHDRSVAQRLFEQGIPLPVIESALLLATLRRRSRPTDATPLSPIRSLAYFLPVIAELQQQPLPDGYLDYLRRKMAAIAKPLPARAQFSTFLSAR